MKERARRLVALEAEEDTESQQARRAESEERDVERTGICDPQQDQTCESQRRRRPRPPASTNDDAPNSLDPTPDTPPQIPYRTLRSGLDGQSEAPTSAG